MEDDLPIDAVEMVRTIRDRHYDETKHMTREEKKRMTIKELKKALLNLGN